MSYVRLDREAGTWAFPVGRCALYELRRREYRRRQPAGIAASLLGASVALVALYYIVVMTLVG